jgi:hypothetical protein
VCRYENTTTLNGNTAVNGTNTFTVGTGATALGGALTVTGATVLNGSLTIPTGGVLGAVLTSNANDLATWAYSNGTTSLQSGNYTILLSDRFIFFNGSAAATFTLPAATSNAGKKIVIKNKTAFTLTVNRSGSETIFQDSAITGAQFITLGTEASNNWVRLVSDGTHWVVFRALF